MLAPEKSTSIFKAPVNSSMIFQRAIFTFVALGVTWVSGFTSKEEASTTTVLTVSSTATPSVSPTTAPSASPSEAPTEAPTASPTVAEVVRIFLNLMLIYMPRLQHVCCNQVLTLPRV